MANFNATTASNTPAVKEGAAERLPEILAKYTFENDLTIEIEDGCLVLYGYGWPDAYRRTEDEDDYESVLDDLLLDLSTLLAEPLIIQAVGHENCRFPLAAHQWRVPPDATSIEQVECQGCFTHE